MIEVVGDLWTYPADIRCITTNGMVNSRGEAVMGRGCALQAKQRWPHIAKSFGTRLLAEGNKVLQLAYVTSALNNGGAPFWLLSFPTKHHWRDEADLDLIARSAGELTDYVAGWEGLCERSPVVVIPRPGVGNGKRDWETEVKPILSDLLDDRFHIITNI